MNGFEHAFSGERVAINQVERAAIQREPAGVLDPEGAQNVLGSRRPERYFLRFDL
jgi:hypothetical protein